MNMKINLEKLKNCKNKKQLTRRLLRNLKSQKGIIASTDNITLYMVDKSLLRNNNTTSTAESVWYRSGHVFGTAHYAEEDGDGPRLSYTVNMSYHTSSNHWNEDGFDYQTKLNVVISDKNGNTHNISDHVISHSEWDVLKSDFVSTDKTTENTFISHGDWVLYYHYASLLKNNNNNSH